MSPFAWLCLGLLLAGELWLIMRLGCWALRLVLRHEPGLGPLDTGGSHA